MEQLRTVLRFFRRWKPIASIVGIVCGLCLNTIAIAQMPSDSRLPPFYHASPQLSAREHPWGRFLPQTWTRTQTTTTTNQNGQQIRSVSETKTTLESVGPDSLTLNIVSSVDMGGRSVPTSQQRVVVDFYQEPLVVGAQIRSLPSTTLMIDKQLIPCGIRTYETTGVDTHWKTTVWFSSQIYPYMLRVEKVQKSNQTENLILCQSTMEVTETGATDIRTSKRGTYRLRTVTQNAGITTDSKSSCSRHVPGGTLHETVQEFAANGTLIRSSETRLINYRCAESEAVSRTPPLNQRLPHSTQLRRPLLSPPQIVQQPIVSPRPHTTYPIPPARLRNSEAYDDEAYPYGNNEFSPEFPIPSGREPLRFRKRRL